jgi:ribosomal protein S30
LWAYNFGSVRRKNPKISLKNQEFIGDSIKQIKKYGYRVKNRSYLRFCPAKSEFLDVYDKKCLFLTQEKSTIANFSAKMNYTGVKRMS